MKMSLRRENMVSRREGVKERPRQGGKEEADTQFSRTFLNN